MSYPQFDLVEKDKSSFAEEAGLVAVRDAPTSVNETERKRILRKMDLNLLPFVSLLYLLSFLDRSNIGNAKVAGMAKDLHFVHLDYNVVAAVFFIPYALAEVPSNIALKFFRPSRWIPSIMVAWGLVMTFMSLCTSYEGLIVARIFLGLTEAGLFPGIAYYLSLWYPRRKLAMRVAVFFSAATLAGAFGGLLAYGIERMEGVGGLHGWQWIFCLEGIATVLVAFASFFLMHDFPETATFLTNDERVHVLSMLKEDDHLATHFDRQFIWQALCDYKVWLHVGMALGNTIPIYTLSLFTPTIVKDLGYSAARAQLLTIPIFILGCITTITIGVISDEFNIRGPCILGCLPISLIGYIVLITQTTPGIAYIGAILTAVGLFPTIAVHLAWAGGNAGGSLKRGVVIAMIVGGGNLGGICASFVYLDPPRFRIGHSVVIGWLCSCILLSATAMWNYARLNKEKIALCEREGIDELQKEKFSDMGDKSPLFRYVL